MTKCGKTHSEKGRPFTPKTLAQHERDCFKCSGGKPLRFKKQQKHFDDDLDIDSLGIIDDDLPDGAYWAMHDEFYGW